MRFSRHAPVAGETNLTGLAGSVLRRAVTSLPPLITRFLRESGPGRMFPYAPLPGAAPQAALHKTGVFRDLPAKQVLNSTCERHTRRSSSASDRASVRRGAREILALFSRPGDGTVLPNPMPVRVAHEDAQERPQTVAKRSHRFYKKFRPRFCPGRIVFWSRATALIVARRNASARSPQAVYQAEL